MLETVISKCIMLYLKEYLKPLGPGQLELEVLQGMMKIYNLQLLPSALAVHHIPFIIKKGCVKYVKVIFPWNNLKNSAVDILCEDLFFVLQFDSNILLKSDIQADQKSIHIKSEPFSISREEQIKIVQGLFESVIDNLHVQIKNIHLRIEFPCDPKPIIIGISIPDIAFETVDEKDNVVLGIQHPKFVRKRLTIKDFSIYFDTNQEMMEIKDDDSIQSFTDLMMKMMKKDHQYLFKPTDFKSVLIHTKDKTEKITNQVQTTINEIALNLDLPQCRSIVHLNYIWSQFMKRRKYTNCMRPISFNKVNETWQYAHKCAILKNRPHIFKPYLALTILKSRLKYLDLFKQAKVSKLSANLLGSPKQKLVSLEKRVGPTAAIYLREYAEAIYVKEESMKDHPDVTAFDISELKNIFESTEFVFSLRQFSSSIQINSFKVEFLYDKDSPLISMACNNFTGGFCTLQDVVNMSIHIKDASVISYVNEEPKEFFHKIPQKNSDINQSDFIFLNMSVPINDFVTTFECVIAPMKLILDNETIGCIFDFFNVKNQKQLDSHNNEISRYEMGELLQYFKVLNNYKMSIKILLMSYDIPFKAENDEIKYLTFELADLNFNKNLDEIVHKKDPIIPMYFSGKMILNAKIDDFTLFKTDDISAKINLVFVNDKLGVTIDSAVDFGTFQIFIQKKHINVISYALKSFTILSNVQNDIMAKKSTHMVLIVGRSKFNFDVELNAINIFLSDDNNENEMKIIIGDLVGSANYYLTSIKYSAVLKNLAITQFDKTFVNIHDKIDFVYDKQTDSGPLIVDANILKPHVYFEFDSIFWLMDFMGQVQNIIPTNDTVQINEPIISIEQDKPIELVSYSNKKCTKSDGSFGSNESRLKLKREFTPSSMILSNMLLTQSIDEFLLGSASFENIPISSHLESEEDNNEAQDEDDDDNIIIPKESVKKIDIKLNLNVADVCMEMIDKGEKKKNSLFTVKSISICDFSQDGYKIKIEEFFIKRENRTIFMVPHLVVPLNLPNPIEVVADYAEAHIFSDDIIALTYDSPAIFKLLFGGKTPLFKNELVVHALAKSGRGSARDQNNDPITTVEVADAYVSIIFEPKELKVDAKLKKCDGVYKDDNSHFITLYDEFHCHYTGTMNDQTISIDVPKAKLTLKHIFLPWFLVFAPLTHVDKSTLQPLKINISVEPGQLNFIAREKEIQPETKKPKLVSISSSIVNYKPDKEYSKIFSFEIGKSKCEALRDKALSLDLNIDDIHINTDKFNHPIFAVKNSHFSMNEKLIKLNIPSININFQVSTLLQLIDEASYLITFFIPSGLKLDNINLPNFGIDLRMHKFIISISPLPRVFLNLELPAVKFLLNPSHSIAGLDIDSVKVYTVNHQEKKNMVLNLSKIRSFLSFSLKYEYNLSVLTFKSIKKLPQREVDAHQLKYVLINYKMDLIQVNYTHFFAKILITSIFRMLINCKTIPLIANMSLDFLTKIKVNIDCFINKIQVNFFVIDPFASLELSHIKLMYKDKWEASINDLSLLPITKENEENSSPYSSFMIKKNEKEDLVSITVQDGQLYSVISENNLFINFKILFSLIQFMMASPFLKIKPILNRIKKLENPNEMIIDELGFAEISKSLPFDLILHIKKTDISIPITKENELQLHISALLSITSSDLSINLSSLSLNFYDINSKTAFPSIISNLTADFSIGIEEDFSLALQANILDINMVFSIRDIYNLILLMNNIEEILNSQIFTFEESNFDIFRLRIYSIELISSNIILVLCKDTRSYSQIVPIFRTTIPPIMFKVQKSKGITQNPVVFNVKPFVEFYNVVTGNFDLIIEPINLRIFAYIIDEQMKFGINVADNININFPLTAIMTFEKLIGEIKESLKNKKIMEFEDLPSVWLCNKLGSKIVFTVGKEKHSVEHNKFIPLFNIPIDTPISFSIDNENYMIESNSFNYPTYLSAKILAVKKPYKGGMMISFERTFQIENNLSFILDFYVYDNETKKFDFVSSIDPHERQPLIFDKEVLVSFVKKGETNYIKNNSIKLHLLNKSLSTFQIECDNKKKVLCIKSVYNDTTIAARIVSISSRFMIYNLLPSTLYFKTVNEEVTSVNRGETTDFYGVEEDTFSAFLSFSEDLFLKQKSRAKIDFKKTNEIYFYNSFENVTQKCMIEFSFEKEIDQTTIILYMPVVIFNTTLFLLDIGVSNAKNNFEIESNKNYSNSIEVLPKSNNYWCPPSLIDNSDDDSLMISIFTNGNSKKPSEPFDCLTTGNKTMFLTSLKDENLFVPLRCNISNQSRTSILTISPLITIINNLDINFELTPIRNIPTDISEKSLLKNVEGKISICDKFGSPFEFPAHSRIMLPFIPINGTVSISIKDYSTTPSLSLLEPQKTVFKVQNQTNYILIELIVTDVETEIIVEFNKVVFPTPILINNQLDDTVYAFQLVYLTPFEIMPHSTSIFAFDEPYIYPSVAFWFDDKNFYRISLAEDTEKIEMKRKFKGLPVYIQVKHNKYGNRLIIISQEKEEAPEKYKFIFQSSIFGIAASLIDFQMRETALVYLSKFESQITFNSEYLAFSSSLQSFQIDDQNPLASNPTVIYGYYTENDPCISFNCLRPMSTSAFTSLDYFAINIQRIDVNADCSFISDWLNLSTSFKMESIHSIKPKEPSKINQKSLVAFRYFEIAPALFILSFNRKTSRPPMLGKIPRFLKFVPSVKAKRIVIPGIVLSRITDRIGSIQTKLIDDYKTEAFKEILGMLGGAGKLLKILGIASAIASSFNIKMTSDMTSQFSLSEPGEKTNLSKILPLSNQIIESESSIDLLDVSKFDNQIEDDLDTCFSFKPLSLLMNKINENSMKSSPLIQFIMPKFGEIDKKEKIVLEFNDKKDVIEKKLNDIQKMKNEVIKTAGLHLKIISGIEYGRGIAGVLTKELNDPLQKIDPMSLCKRTRETRPYAGAKISKFDPSIAIAQKIIFQNGGLNEKAKEISVSNDGNKKTFIIMTENTLYVFSDDLKNIITSVKFSDIQKVKIDGENIVKLKLKNGKKVIINIDSKISINFLLSLLRMNNQFEESLLL